MIVWCGHCQTVPVKGNPRGWKPGTLYRRNTGEIVSLGDHRGEAPWCRYCLDSSEGQPEDHTPTMPSDTP